MTRNRCCAGVSKPSSRAGLDINIFLLSRSSLAASGGKFLPLRPRKRSQRQYQQHILCECPLVTAARPVAAETVKPFRVKPPGLQPATRPSHGRLSTNPNPTPIRRTKLLWNEKPEPWIYLVSDKSTFPLQILKTDSKSAGTAKHNQLVRIHSNTRLIWQLWNRIRFNR